MRWTFATLLVLAACSKKTTSDASRPTAAKVERWAASAIVGTKFNDLVVEFEDGGASLVHGDHKIPLTDVTYTADKITFTLEHREKFELARQGDRADGKDTIGADTLVVRMVKLADGEAPRSAFARPQTPKPPFAYPSRALDVDTPEGGKLAGTLALPEGAGPFPVVVLLSGSGQEDRDETILWIVEHGK